MKSDSGRKKSVALKNELEALEEDLIQRNEVIVQLQENLEASKTACLHCELEIGLCGERLNEMQRGVGERS